MNMEYLLTESKAQLLNPLGDAKRKLLIILNAVYCILLPYFLISEKLTTGSFTPSPLLLVVYLLAFLLNLFSAIYNVRLRKKKKLLLEKSQWSSSESSQKIRLDQILGVTSIVPILLMSFLNITGFGNPSNDAILTDFAMAQSLMIVLVVILGRVATSVWFAIVIGALIINVWQRGWNYEYHYSTPSEIRQYKAALDKNEHWALERKAELENAGLNPPKITRYFHIWMVFILISFLTAIFFSGITIDILKIIPTVVKNIEGALQNTKELELESNAYKETTNTFINLAHETKTPLTLINNYLQEYISKKGENNEELRVLKDNIQKLTNDIVNFFDIERLNRGVAVYDHRVVASISELLESRVALFAHSAKSKGIAISWDIEPNLNVSVNPAAVDRIINNLIENALKYTELQGQIKIGLHKIDDYVVFQVKDNGCGIPEELQAGVFEPYVQLSTSKRNSDGMGLGLSIVKKIVDQVEGKVRLVSKEGIGTEMTVFLPFANADGCATVPGASKHNHSSIPSKDIPEDQINDDSKPYLIVLEDNVEMLQYLIKTLSLKYNVYGARNGLEAFEKIRSVHKLHLIISDVMMDRMDGFEFAEEIISNENLRHVPIIFITAKTSAEDRKRAYRLGAVDFIEKPFMGHDLLAKVDALLLNLSRQQSAFVREANKMLGHTPIVQDKQEEYIVVSKDLNYKKFNLTNREIEIVDLLRTGLPYKNIADKLDISVPTVNRHVANIFHKLDVRNKLEAIKRLQEN
jgi:signal transduction histidine kinase/DNA-binding NarL/FixJ family response regulator